MLLLNLHSSCFPLDVGFYLFLKHPSNVWRSLANTPLSERTESQSPSFQQLFWKKLGRLLDNPLTSNLPPICQGLASDFRFDMVCPAIGDTGYPWIPQSAPFFEDFIGEMIINIHQPWFCSGFARFLGIKTYQNPINPSKAHSCHSRNPVPR
jgi:hypothetical protein